MGKRQSACIVHRLEAKSILRCRVAAARRKSPAVWGDSMDPILKVRCSLYTGAQRVHKTPNTQWRPESQCPLDKATPPGEGGHPFWEGFEQSWTQGHQRKPGEITQWAEVIALICDGLSSVLGSCGRKELTPKGVAL